MKRFLFSILAALALAGCTEKLTDTGSPAEKGELERSYISVTLKSDDAGTRAQDDPDFEYGEADERYVDNVHFFLFKDDGSAFPVNAVGGKNYLSFEVKSSGNQPDETGKPNEGPNISDVKDKILVFDNYKGEYPTHIVAVLNWDAKYLQPSYSLDNLYNTLAGICNTAGHFVMSNSVYADMQGKIVRANALTIDHIGKTEEEAKAHPVEIYVERISAKVQVEAQGNVSEQTSTYDIDQTVSETPVYAKVLNWELYNEYHHSIVLKHIYPETWGMGGQIGFLWNDPNRFRSYWAGSYTGTFPADNCFDWAGGIEPGGTAYCGENSRQAEMDAEGNVTSDPRTKVIIKAQLVDAMGNGVEVANWYGHHYIGEDAVRTEIASLLASELFYADGAAYKAIGGADLKAVPGTQAPEGAEIEAYEVFFQLSDEGAAKEWFTYSSAEGYVSASDEAINARLAQVQPALVYKNGMTYYFTEIKHLGSKGSASEYGVIRNHVYKVNISDIKGLGTPVYDPEVDVDVPEHPTDTHSYVSAQVHILSWKVVKNDYSVE